MTQQAINTLGGTSSPSTGGGRGEALRVIIAGGGTGGHIFPAIAIANALQQQHPNTEILFVGAKGKMETDFVPITKTKLS